MSPLHNAWYHTLLRVNKHKHQHFKHGFCALWVCGKYFLWLIPLGHPPLWPWVRNFLPETVPGVLHSVMEGQDVRGNLGFQKIDSTDTKHKVTKHSAWPHHSVGFEDSLLGTSSSWKRRRCGANECSQKLRCLLKIYDKPYYSRLLELMQQT